jgi:hypothetical protein
VGVRRHRVLDKPGSTSEVAVLEELVSHLQEVACFSALFLPLGVVDLWHGVLASVNRGNRCKTRRWELPVSSQD